MTRSPCDSGRISSVRLLVSCRWIACKRHCALRNSYHYVSSFIYKPTPIAMIDILHEPALKAPPGVISQFPTTSSDEQSWWYVGVTISMIVPGILLLLRLYTKLYVVRKVDLTDCLTSTPRLLRFFWRRCRFDHYIFREGPPKRSLFVRL